MFQLFQSIFSNGEKHGNYPESLIEAAIERAVAATDPRIRTLPGYSKLLRNAVIHAIDDVSNIIDSLPQPMPADRKRYGSDDSSLSTLFASAEHMQEVFIHDPLLSEWRDSSPALADQVTALLLVKRDEKRVMGMEMAGEIMRRDVPQVTVSFQEPRLVDPTDSEEETRRQLKRRAFDYLLSLALLRISEVQLERTDLDKQRNLLQRKLRALKQGGWSFADADQAPPDPTALQAELNAVEKELTALGVNDNLLRSHLDIVAKVLTEAGQHFWVEDIELRLDRMNIQRDAQYSSARNIKFQELHDARGRRLVMLLISIPLNDLPQREDFVTAAKRYLG